MDVDGWTWTDVDGRGRIWTAARRSMVWYSFPRDVMYHGTTCTSCMVHDDGFQPRKGKEREGGGGAPPRDDESRDESGGQAGGRPVGRSVGRSVEGTGGRARRPSSVVGRDVAAAGSRHVDDACFASRRVASVVGGVNRSRAT